MGRAVAAVALVMLVASFAGAKGVEAHWTNPLHLGPAAGAGAKAPLMHRATAGPRSSVRGTTSLHACTVATGPAGDATPVASIENQNTPASQDDLDLISLALTSNATSVTAHMHVTKLGNSPAGTPVAFGDGNLWITTFNNPAGKAAFLMAKYPGTVNPSSPPAAGTVPVDFFYGLNLSLQGTGVPDYYTMGYATGALDYTNNSVDVTATFAQLGGKFGDNLGGPNALTRIGYGTVGMTPPQTLPFDDPGALQVDGAMVNNGNDYQLGIGCNYQPPA